MEVKLDSRTVRGKAQVAVVAGGLLRRGSLMTGVYRPAGLTQTPQLHGDLQIISSGDFTGV